MEHHSTYPNIAYQVTGDSLLTMRDDIRGKNDRGIERYRSIWSGSVSNNM
jgi:hypothetical protein